jgi:hypothetical protein
MAQMRASQLRIIETAGRRESTGQLERIHRAKTAPKTDTLGSYLGDSLRVLRSRSLSADQVIGGPLKRAIAAAAGISIAMALGVTVTILLSRISRSESLIRVDASDLWSAIVVGFAANYVGLRIFQSILPTGDESPVERKENEGCV